MSGLTYNTLAAKIAQMTDDQRYSDVAVYISGVDEVYPIRKLVFTPPDDPEELDPTIGILDDGHPYLTI